MEENKEELKRGDVVQLQSGGPSMTVMEVTKYQTYSEVECVWFPNPELRPIKETFRSYMLGKI